MAEKVTATTTYAIGRSDEPGFDPEAWAKLLAAGADILWPLTAILFLLLFRKQIAEFLRRLKQLKIFGQEVSLEDELDDLAEVVEGEASPGTESRTNVEGSEAPAATQAPSLDVKAAAEMAGPATLHFQRIDIPPPSEFPTETELVQAQRTILQTAAASPRAAIMLAAAEIEAASRRLAASLGLEAAAPSFRQVLGQLRRYLPDWVTSGLELFWDIRNRMVHGAYATDTEVLRAIDSGLRLLRAIEEVPHEVHTVRFTDIALFTDPKGEIVSPGVRGLILESWHTQTKQSAWRIFPTTSLSYRPGQRVAWKFNPRNTWGRCWYRDPVTKEIRLAWDSSSEFVGDEVDLMGNTPQPR